MAQISSIFSVSASSGVTEAVTGIQEFLPEYTIERYDATTGELSDTGNSFKVYDPVCPHIYLKFQFPEGAASCYIGNKVSGDRTLMNIAGTSPGLNLQVIKYESGAVLFQITSDSSSEWVRKGGRLVVFTDLINTLTGEVEKGLVLHYSTSYYCFYEVVGLTSTISLEDNHLEMSGSGTYLSLANSSYPIKNIVTVPAHVCTKPYYSEKVQINILRNCPTSFTDYIGPLSIGGHSYYKHTYFIISDEPET